MAYKPFLVDKLLRKTRSQRSDRERFPWTNNRGELELMVSEQVERTACPTHFCLGRREGIPPRKEGGKDEKND